MFSSEKARAVWSEVHLDAIRGIAALIVVFGHARGLFFSSLTSLATQPMPKTNALGPSIVSINIGNEAVMVFFVLSGYLVGGSVLRQMRQNRWEWQNYLATRLTRLWIVLIPAVLIGAAIDYVGFTFFAADHSIYTAPAGQDYISENSFQSIKNITIYLGNLFFLQTIFFPVIGTNAPLWSLSNEFWYYILFPCMILIFMSKRRVQKISSLIFCMVIIYFNNDYSNFLFLVWIMGAFVSWLPKKIPARYAPGIAALSALMFALFFMILKKLHLSLYLSDLLCGIAASGFIYCVSCHTTQCRPSYYGYFSRYFSEISYTLYLTHLPALFLICALINTPWSIHSIRAISFLKFSLACFFVVIWASILYKLFESKTDIVRRKILLFLSHVHN